MKKRIIIITILVTLLSIGIISVYSTYAYNEEDNILDESDANYNLIYSIRENSNKEVVINSKEEKYVNITLTNTYESTVKYGMYYYLINPKTLPENVTITLAEDSIDLLENIIKPNQTRSISIKIVNNSEKQLELIIGALVGFEKGNIEDLATNGEQLIK
ncbi:MAG: hypothetical protein IJZ79_07275 [Bacilli bacterium]|nr:hypothetical protein [Bacilli bacterium]